MMKTTNITAPAAASLHLIVYTQYSENYGAHSWDGKGKCPQYWKMKGGSEIEIATLTQEQADDQEYFHSVLARAYQHPQICWSSDYSSSFVANSDILAAGELTYSEKLAMEYEGKIGCMARKIIYV